MIPVACVGVHYKFGPCPQIFLRALTPFRGWAAWLTWQELPSAELEPWHPRALRLSPSLPAPYERGGVALSGIAPVPCPHGMLVPRVPFQGSLVPTALPTWHFGAPGPFPQVAHAHYTIPVPWTLGLLWPTSPVPGVPSKQILTFQQPCSQPLHPAGGPQPTSRPCNNIS